MAGGLPLTLSIPPMPPGYELPRKIWSSLNRIRTITTEDVQTLFINGAKYQPLAVTVTVKPADKRHSSHSGNMRDKGL